MVNRVEMYSFGIQIPEGIYREERLDLAPHSTPDRAIRVRKVLTSVRSEGVAIIDGIYVAKENQILGYVDAFELSATLAERLRTAFLTEHNLLEKSHEEIQTWLDDNKMELPGVPRLELPTIGPDAGVHLTGNFKESFVITFIGLAAGV